VKRERDENSENKPDVYFEIETRKCQGPFITIDQLSQSLMRTAILDGNPPIIKIYQLIDGVYQMTSLEGNFQTLMNLTSAIELALNSTPKRICQQKSWVMEASLFAEEKLKNSGEIVSDKGTSFIILNSQRTDFVSRPIVSLGEQIFKSNSREGIILDPKSATLENIYTGIIRILPQCSSLLKMLDIVLGAFKNLFLHTHQLHLDKVVRGRTTDSISPKNEGEICHLVPLQAFLQEQTGVCRHHSLLACYLIDRLIKGNRLPAAAVHQVRGHVRGGDGHAWVMIKKKNGEWIHFDSQWKIIRAIDQDGYTALCNEYTQEAIDGALKKLNEPDNSDHTSVQGPSH
jgi:hypothetical protein